MKTLLVNSGGGIYVQCCTNTTISGFVYNNTVTGALYGGGGICIEESYTNTVTGNVYGNTSGGYGGGIYIYDSDSNSISGDVYENVVNNVPLSFYGGGGIMLQSWSFYTTISGKVYKNIVNGLSDATGGGITVYDTCRYIRIAGPVYSNTNAAADAIGGGIYANMNNDNDIEISGPVFGNVSYADAGGIALLSKAGKITGPVYNNSAADNGGGIYLSCDNTFIHCSIYSNISGLGAGIITMSGADNNNISNTYIFGNYSTNYGGGICFFQGINNMVYGGTVIANNRAATAGSGLYIDQSSPMILDSFITNNYADTYDSVIGMHLANNTVISNCRISGTNSSFAFALYEEGGNTINHGLYTNLFATNALGYLYYDFGGSIISNHEIDVLNTGADARHNADPSTGNVSTSF
ncbi:hypothetical protein ACFL6D_03705 [Spirochaetota bacterium]